MSLHRSCRFFAFFLSLCLCLPCLLTGCAHTVTEKKNGSYVDASTGIAYYYAGIDWMPVTVGRKYASITTGKTSFPLHTVEGLSPTEWLCSPDGDLFFAENVEMPSLADFHADVMTICRQMQKDKLVDTVDDAEIVASVVTLYLTGEQLAEPDADPIDRLELYFTSASCPGIRFHMMLLVYEEPIVYENEKGFAFSTDTLLYCRGENRYVDANSVLEAYAV